MWLAKVHVTLKKGVLDPQGAAVMKSLHTLGYAGVEDTRVGKYMEVKLADMKREEAERQVKDICNKLLANPVIEDYQYELAEV